MRSPDARAGCRRLYAARARRGHRGDRHPRGRGDAGGRAADHGRPHRRDAHRGAGAARGMVGKPGDGRFGFVGDIGRLPASFQELAQPGGLPAYTTSTTRGIGMGWRGPYVNIGTSANDYLTDAFGRAYTGASSGQVRSAGPDGVAGNADDIVYPPAAPDDHRHRDRDREDDHGRQDAGRSGRLPRGSLLRQRRRRSRRSAMPPRRSASPTCRWAFTRCAS